MKPIVHNVVMPFLIVILSAGTLTAADQKPAQPVADQTPTAGSAADEKKPLPKNEIIKQREFVRMLVSGLRWQQGLPKKPSDSDYLDILGGRRSFLFEAENHHARNDNVFVKEYDRDGSFSGRGWVSGVSVPSTVHFSVHIPVEGDYVLSVSVKGEPQVWSIGGRTFKVAGGDHFTEKEAGTVHLAAGNLEFTVEMPAHGGIDCFTLDAPPLTSIEPLEGWRLDAPLTLLDVAHTTTALLDWEKGLPDDAAKGITIPISEAVPLPPHVSRTTANYLGPFSSKEWVRAAANQGAVLRVPLIMGDSAAYDIRVRYMGETLTAELDGRKFVKPGKPYLDWISLGLNRLKIGAHTLTLKLLPGAGVDVVTLVKRKSAPADYLKLAGIEGSPGDKVTRGQAEKFITSFVERFKERH